MNRRPPRNGDPKVNPQNTLLIDGNALFKVGFFGAKDQYNHRGEHIGGVYQFLTVLRKLLNEDLYHRVYVFWDGKFSGKMRFQIYPPYKSGRGKDYINGTQPIDEVEMLEKGMIWNYLDELCIRQIQHTHVESDDFIGYYCLNKDEGEKVTVCTNDRDMCQLIEEDVRIYFCDLKNYVTVDNYNQFFDHHNENSVLLKTIIGDNSDSIKGVKGVKEQKLISLFPEIKNRKVLLSEIIDWSKEMQLKRIEDKKPPLQVLNNLINGITDGVQGDKLYEINFALVNLKNPMITDDAIEELNNLKEGEFDTTDRSIKNVLLMMKKDGLEKAIGKTRNEEYLIPFKKLIARELKQSII